MIEEAQGEIAALCILSQAAAIDLSAAESPAVDSPDVIARLEALDDAVFDAIRGKAAAMDDLRVLWPTVKSELGEALLAESREQYIRFALDVWRQPADFLKSRDAASASHALEVLHLLLDEAG